MVTRQYHHHADGDDQRGKNRPLHGALGTSFIPVQHGLKLALNESFETRE